MQLTHASDATPTPVATAPQPVRFALGMDPRFAKTNAGSHDATIPRAAMIGLALCVIGIWMLEHPYIGLINDAILYALGAFARLHPVSLGHDIFLSHGSQNGYTIFSPLVAPLMRVMGVGRAAALVTLTNQVIFFGACTLLARKVMPTRLAVLSIALLVALPGLYGDKHIFWFTEPLMTPRVTAEAFVIGALACAVDRRYVLMSACIIMGMLIHPIMTLPGIVLLFLLFLGLRRPWLTAILAVGGLTLVSLASRMTPFGRVTVFDPLWLHVLHTQFRYLFPSLWSLAAWGRMAIPAATLFVGALAQQPTVTRVFCRAALATAVLGLGISIIGSDLLHIVLVAQVQPWRWLWLSNGLAILLLPMIALQCWRDGASSRAAVVLVAAAWIGFDQRLGGLLALLAAAVATLRPLRPDGRLGRILLIGAGVALLGSATWFLVSTVCALKPAPAPPPSLTLIQSMYWAVATRWLPWARGGVLPAFAFLGLWAAAQHRSAATYSRRSAILVVGATLCAALMPFAWKSWTDFAPSVQMQAKFSPWRRAIPRTAEVYTPGMPLIPWFLLERRSYWSTSQMSGAVFSRTTAITLLRRERLLDDLHRARNSKHALAALCAADRAIGFVVTSANMGPTPFKPVILGDRRIGAVLRLYSCSVERAKAEHTPHSATTISRS